MASTQYPSYPYPSWSTEISGGPSQGGAHASTTTTTTTTSSASAGPQMGGQAPQMTTITTNSSSAPSMQNTAPMQSAAPMQGAVSMQGAAPGMGSAAGGSVSAQPSASVPSRNEFEGSSGTLDLETHQPIEVIEAPTSMNEAFLGSMKSMLMRNRGSFVTATFLIGTQGTTTWEGILHDVGNDHIIIFQPGRQRYIACDLYALKYIEFYDTRERDACRQLLRQSGRNSQMNYGRNDFY